MLNVVSQAHEPHAEQMHGLCTSLGPSCRSLFYSGKLLEASKNYLDSYQVQPGGSESCWTVYQKERSGRNGVYLYSPTPRAVEIHVLKCDWMDKKMPSQLFVTWLMACGCFKKEQRL